MRCNNCYNEIPEGSKFCQACGAPVQAEAPTPAPAPAPTPVPEPAPAPVPEAAPEIPVAQPAPEPTYTTEPPVAQPAPTYTANAADPVPQPQPQPQPAAASGSVDKKAIGSLVCGIVGIFVAGLILGIIAIILGNQVRKTAPAGSTSRTMATAGFILGIIDIAGYALVMFLGCGVLGVNVIS